MSIIGGLPTSQEWKKVNGVLYKHGYIPVNLVVKLSIIIPKKTKNDEGKTDYTLSRYHKGSLGVQFNKKPKQQKKARNNAIKESIKNFEATLHDLIVGDDIKKMRYDNSFVENLATTYEKPNMVF